MKLCCDIMLPRPGQAVHPLSHVVSVATITYSTTTNHLAGQAQSSLTYLKETLILVR